MSATLQILRSELRNVARSKWVLAYGLFFLAVTDVLFRFGGSGAGVLVSLMNVVLLLIPLIAVVFGVIYLHGAREFVELLLAQPVPRRRLFAGLYGGLALPLAAAFALGVGLPFAVHGVEAGHGGTLAVLLGGGVVLTLVFVAVAFTVALRFEDRLKGLGVALSVWLLLAVLYDGLVLVLVGAFADYPLEKPVLGLMLLNPVDLVRVLLLLGLDASALMGYTGAVFARFFGSAAGAAVAAAALALWVAVPLALGRRAFARKDF